MSGLYTHKLVRMMAEEFRFKNYRYIQNTMNTIAQPFRPSPYVYVGLQRSTGQPSLINQIADFFGLTKEEIESGNRKRTNNKARSYYSFIHTELLKDKSLSKVGRELGGRDHSTIIHQVSSFKSDVETNQDFKDEFIEFLNKYQPTLIDKFNRLSTSVSNFSR